MNVNLFALFTLLANSCGAALYAVSTFRMFKRRDVDRWIFATFSSSLFILAIAVAKFGAFEP